MMGVVTVGAGHPVLEVHRTPVIAVLLAVLVTAKAALAEL
jgi:hypothetical protein